MPVFHYKAKKENAETVIGEIKARDSDEAVDLVSRMGLIPVNVSERAGDFSSTGWGVSRMEDISSSPVSTRDLLVFTRQLVSLLGPGVPILKSLELLSLRSRSRRLSSTLKLVAVEVRNGRSLSAAMSDHGAVFPPLYIAMVRAGEESGRMKEMLAGLTVYFRRQQEISSRIRAALVYPAFMLFIGAATVVFVLTFVMPRIMVLFRDLHTTLPLPTVIVMALSVFLRKFWPLVIMATAGVFLVLRIPLVAAAFTSWLRRLVSFLPYAGDLPLTVDIERFTRTLALLLDSGISLLKALDISIPTLADPQLRIEMQECRKRISGGAPFGETLTAAVHFPADVAQLVAVGEESGQLAGALKDIAETCEEDINEKTRSLMSLLEPVLILAVGLVVGFLVFAMLMPIFQMDVFAR